MLHLSAFSESYKYEVAFVIPVPDGAWTPTEQFHHIAFGNEIILGYSFSEPGEVPLLPIQSIALRRKQGLRF